MAAGTCSQPAERLLRAGIIRAAAGQGGKDSSSQSRCRALEPALRARGRKAQCTGCFLPAVALDEAVPEQRMHHLGLGIEGFVQSLKEDGDPGGVLRIRDLAFDLLELFREDPYVPLPLVGAKPVEGRVPRNGPAPREQVLVVLGPAGAESAGDPDQRLLGDLLNRTVPDPGEPGAAAPGHGHVHFREQVLQRLSTAALRGRGQADERMAVR